MLDGKISEHATVKNYASALEVDTDSATDVLLRAKNGVTAHVHQNFFERPARRDYRFRFSTATATVDFFANRLTLERAGKPPRITELTDFDRNDLFLDQTRDFLRRLRAGAESGYTRDQIATSRKIVKILQ